MSEQEEATKQDMQNESSSGTTSAEQSKKSHKRNGWICLGLMLVVAAINGSGILTGAFVDVLQTGLLVGAIICFVAAARVKVTK